MQWPNADGSKVSSSVLVQLPNQANMVQCDAALNGLFGEKVIKVSSLSARVAPLLQPCPRPLLEYTIG